jgi:uncharacterized protein YndB with AHSA1/START domain
MSTWRAQTTAPAPPEEVLEVLTHPAALARWSPVGFEIEELTTTRLCSGTHARVTGCLAGRQVKFDVDVMQADPERLLLHACGPVGLDVEYTITPAPHGSAIDVTITLRGQRGITKAVIARALHLLLAVGGLEVALARLVREVEDHDQRPTPPRRRPVSTATPVQARAGKLSDCGSCVRRPVLSSIGEMGVRSGGMS